MIAEINGKISRTGTNLKETLEDNLTGNVFGSLRYIPFSKGIKKVLNNVIEDKYFNEYEAEEWSENIEFWPYHKDGEIDLIINLNLVTIAIEVKYNSGLSSDDDVCNSNNNFDESNNQLSREARIIKEFAQARGTKPILLFVARDNEGKEILNSIEERNIIEADVDLKFISWEDIYLILETLLKENELNFFETVIVKDMVNLLKRKGFNSFKSFDTLHLEDVIVGESYFRFYIDEKSELEEEAYRIFGFKNEINVEKDGYYEFS